MNNNEELNGVFFNDKNKTKEVYRVSYTAGNPSTPPVQNFVNSLNEKFKDSLYLFNHRQLHQELQCWLAGRNFTIPSCWEVEYNRYMLETDPEWGEYVRLKKKFSFYDK